MNFAKSTLRYRQDENYRQDQINKVKRRHKQNKLYPEYTALVKLRSSLYNWKESIEYHRRKIGLFQKRIDRAAIQKEKLELAWGKKRAERKIR